MTHDRQKAEKRASLALATVASVATFAAAGAAGRPVGTLSVGLDDATPP
jgi:hypothetical protein